MTPDPLGNGTQQFDRLYSTLKLCGYNVRSVWLQVTSPINWPDRQKRNVDFINRIIAKADGYGVIMGIYTNHYDWREITGGALNLDKAKLLWYWNVPNIGPHSEDPSNFDNFRSFGPWKWPVAKQFGQVEPVCGYIANRNIYIPSKVHIGTGIGKDVSPHIGFIGLE
ncbi:hypothetical protein OESDEN_06581 [Oesophagostomum dentatum]|uniref:Uncharacterized protein n=1 Tax=Oesophagostomum dentatum TaxID=61180 RepID=A0A0B1T7F9_OESDE|nr:hypothetical protein OESDEN_06581 [Oesophagostomum dentatum]